MLTKFFLPFSPFFLFLLGQKDGYKKKIQRERAQIAEWQQLKKKKKWEKWEVQFISIFDSELGKTNRDASSRSELNWTEVNANCQQQQYPHT